MENVLDNPVWNALVSGNAHLALGSERVKFFDPQISPFAALIDNSRENLQELYHLYSAEQPVFLWAAEQLPVPGEWEVAHCIKGLQMVYLPTNVEQHAAERITALGEKNVPEMLALTKLTRPGPFGTRTIEFGHYEGIFEDAKLAAMTGRRFHCYDHVEISAVCTHPQHLGKGFAKKLLVSQLAQLLASSYRPYLHVRDDNERAIHVYKALGFSVRMPVYFYVLKKQAD